jgi:hypothetical protein
MDEDALIGEQKEYYRAIAPEYAVTFSPPGDSLAVYGSQIEMALDRFRPQARSWRSPAGTESGPFSCSVMPRGSRPWTPHPRCMNWRAGGRELILGSATCWPTCSRGIQTGATTSCSSPTGCRTSRQGGSTGFGRRWERPSLQRGGCSLPTNWRTHGGTRTSFAKTSWTIRLCRLCAGRSRTVGRFGWSRSSGSRTTSVPRSATWDGNRRFIPRGPFFWADAIRMDQHRRREVGNSPLG